MLFIGNGNGKLMIKSCLKQSNFGCLFYLSVAFVVPIGCSDDFNGKPVNSIHQKSEQSLGNRGSTLLHSAAQSGKVDTTGTLLFLGLDIDLKNSSGGQHH